MCDYYFRDPNSGKYFGFYCTTRVQLSVCSCMFNTSHVQVFYEFCNGENTIQYLLFVEKSNWGLTTLIILCITFSVR